jgi:hypothetical protein
MVRVLARADVLVRSDLQRRRRERAADTLHSTATQAAEIAGRGRTPAALTPSRRDCQTSHAGARSSSHRRSRDFDTITVPFVERSGPALVKGGANRRQGKPHLRPGTTR